MDVFDQLDGHDLEDWLRALPPYQQEILRTFLATGRSPEDAAREWVSASGPGNTFPFGGQVVRTAFFDKLALEVESFLCGDEKYDEDRKRLLTEFKPTHTYLIASISAVIAPVVGASAVLIAPAVAMLLYVAARLGLNAWCAMRKDQRTGDTSGAT